jgi:hypothetical protein
LCVTWPSYILIYIGIHSRCHIHNMINKHPGWPDEFVKKSPKNVAQSIFLSKLIQNLYLNPKLWATSVFSEKLLKINNRPLSENSPNLVTLQASNHSFLITDMFSWIVFPAHYSSTDRRSLCK